MPLMLRISFIWTFVLLAFSSTPHAAPLTIEGAVSIDAATLIEMVVDQDGNYLIDSRKKNDFDTGHIEGAHLLTDVLMTRENLLEIIGKDNARVIFYCNGLSCGRAANAVRKAVSWGFTGVYYYPGGIDEWKELELPLTGR